MENRERFKKLVKNIEAAQSRLASLTSKQKAALEKEWDVEHAYYSSALEGSDIDRNKFNELGEKVA